MAPGLYSVCIYLLCIFAVLALYFYTLRCLRFLFGSHTWWDHSCWFGGQNKVPGLNLSQPHIRPMPSAPCCFSSPWTQMEPGSPTSLGMSRESVPILQIFVFCHSEICHLQCPHLLCVCPSKRLIYSHIHWFTYNAQVYTSTHLTCMKLWIQ